MRRLLGVACVTAVLLCASTATPTTLLPLSFNEIVAGAETVFLGQTVSLRSEWSLEPHGKSIVTFVTFNVERVLKGQAGSQVELRFRGGHIGHQVLRIQGMPQFAVGDRDVLFVSSQRNAVSPLVGFSYGRFRVVRDPASRVDLVRGPDGQPFVVPAATGAIASLSAPRMLRPTSYPEFEAFVRDTIARGGR